MRGVTRTFLVQAVGVVVVIGVVYFFFLRLPDTGDLTHIEAPGPEDGPAFVIPGAEGDGETRVKRKGGDSSPLSSRPVLTPRDVVYTRVRLPVDHGPASDQYASTVDTLTKRVRAR